MKILISGASGLIGGHVLNLLLGLENVKIILALRNKSQNRFIESSNLHIKEFDLNYFNPSLNYFDFFDKPDLFIHLAWEGLPNYNNSIHSSQVDKHFVLIKNLLDNGLKKIVVAGTCLEYGLIEGELVEDMEANPITKYGIAKLNLLNLINKYIESMGINTSFIWLRFFYNYSLKIDSNSLVSQLLRSIMNQNDVFDMSNGEQVRDFIDIDLLAIFILKLSLQSNASGIINCCSGKPTKVIDLVESIKIQVSSSIKLNRGIFNMPDYEPFIFYGSNQKLLNALKL